MKSVPANKYDFKYFLADCGGHELYQETKGKVLPGRLQKVFLWANLKKEMKVLDFGCGRGELVRKAAEIGCEVHGVDYSKDAIQLSKHITRELSNVKITQASVEEMIFPHEYFDVIFLTDIIEHLNDEQLETLFSKITKYLKGGGRVYIHTAPNRYYYDYGYRIIWASLIGKKKLIYNPRSDYEKAMHVNEQTLRSIKKLAEKNQLNHLVKSSGLSKFFLVEESNQLR